MAEGNSLWKVLFTIFNISVLVFGLGCLTIGIWMNVDKYVMSYFVVLQRDVTDQVLVAAPAIMIVAGLFLIGVFLIGCFGVTKGRKSLLGLYAFILVVVMILELTIGSTVIVFKDDIHRSVKNGMKRQIQEDYLFDNSVGKAWNFIQVRHRCCGADGSWDYKESNWWYGENPGIENLEEASVWVPNTCCVLDYNQDRDPSKVNPQDVQEKDAVRCQEDAWGNMDGSEYLHGRGCFATALDRIYAYLYVLIVLGMVIGIFQLMGLMSTCMLMRSDKFEQ